MQIWEPIDALFYATDIGGWIGPIAILIVFFMVLTKREYKPLGIFFIIVESLIAWTYLELVVVTPWYWWNVIIMIFGVIICMIQMISR